HLPVELRGSDVLALASGQKAMAFWLGFDLFWPWLELALAWPGIHSGRSQNQADFPAKSHGLSQAKPKPGQSQKFGPGWLEIFRGQAKAKMTWTLNQDSSSTCLKTSFKIFEVVSEYFSTHYSI
ncbi:hypothetical protein B0H11DRAFT_1989757, partial [Mycena galericulata]